MGKEKSLLLVVLCLSLFIINSFVSAKEILPGTKLKIVTKDGITHFGKYETANDNAISINLKTGKYILINRNDIASSYRRGNYAQEGFVVGIVGGTLIYYLIHTMKVKDDPEGKGIGYAIGFSGLVLSVPGYILGSLIKSDQPIDLDDLYISMKVKTKPEDKSIGLAISWNF
ncbi:MAG: hypothetical protein ABIE07_10150 [Candidatus Zixiibacteriota bacterium]